jgi:hypothetical protein
MMTDSLNQLTFWAIGRQQITLDFDGGSVVTDAGLLPLRYAPSVQRFEVFEDYQAEGWLRLHRIVAKIEINRQGTICVVSPWSCPSAFPFRSCKRMCRCDGRRSASAGDPL